MNKFLKIVSISETQQDKNGRKYIKCTFQPLTVLASGMKITSNQHPLTRVLWEKNADGKFGDQLFYDITSGQVSVGDGVEGATMTYNTTEYQVGDNKVTTYSFAYFACENPETYANRQLKANKASIVIGGEVIAPANLVNSELVHQD